MRLPLLIALACAACAAQATSSRPYDDRDWLARFYGPTQKTPAWQPAQAKAAVALLQGASEHGLRPQDYAVDSALPEERDSALTRAMLHYLADLHEGRIASEYHTGQHHSFDPVEELRGALAKNSLPAAVAAAEPNIPIYKHVKATLAHYRTLAATPQPALPPVAGGKLEAGGSYAGIAALRAKLVYLGDLDPNAPRAQGYSPELVQAVKRFQARHGLEADGIIGRGTLEAMNVPLERRVRQLELTLERLRWLPDFAPGRVIAVNLPSFRLWAFDTSQELPLLAMNVIVGQSAKTQTPLFIGTLRYVEFNPYWNVPRSIERDEILPKLAKNPAYLEQNDMELVGAGEPTQEVNAATIEALKAAKLRVRQRPGPKNALGAVKFAMPNADNIYLHSTSARELFKRTRRDLSHGCIRVEDPAALARFVLPNWEAGAIDTALAPGPMQIAKLPATIPVVLFYTTAIGGPDGKAYFAEDIYKRDAVLEEALRD
jgi:murein L,D-transpeptidase YcbB/YkuD